jgi:hypothetical protein
MWCSHWYSADNTNTWKETSIDIPATKKSYCFVFVIYVFAYVNFSFISHFSHHFLDKNYSDVIGEFEK